MGGNASTVAGEINSRSITSSGEANRERIAKRTSSSSAVAATARSTHRVQVDQLRVAEIFRDDKPTLKGALRGADNEPTPTADQGRSRGFTTCRAL